MLSGEIPEVFAPPWWLRLANLIAALCIAMLLVAFSLDRRSGSPVHVTVAGVVGLAVLIWGTRLMLSQVVIAEGALRYRGVLRSRTIPLDQVVGLASGDSWLSFVSGDRPILVSRRPDGSVERISLTCFYLSPRRGAGTGAAERARDELRCALEPYIRANLDRWSIGRG